MSDKILNSFDTWITAQGLKSKGRNYSIDNISLEGITRLRKLILELAIRGKLVPQNPRELSASQILKKMKEEEQYLCERKLIKKPKTLPEPIENEYPFELPTGWAYTRLNSIGEWGAGSTPSRNNLKYYGGDIPWFKSGELKGDFISESEETITEAALNESSLRYNKVGDVLIAMYGANIGQTSILQIPATTNQAVCACTPFAGLNNVFLLKLLRAYNERFIKMGAGGAQPNISREKIIATVIALPPEEEQKRIVSKVDELMALCDELEKQETDHLRTHQLLVETLLGTLTQAQNADELTQAWSRLEAHFDELFITEESVDQLKQTILQLAIMGKLVPQDAKDEPASELLKKIEGEEKELIEKKLIKKPKSLPKIEDSEFPFQLPTGWTYTRLNNIGEWGAGATPSRSNSSYYGGEIAWFKSGELKGDYITSSEETVTELALKETSLRFNKKGDVLIAMYGATIGQASILEIPATTNQAVCACTPFGGIYNVFLLQLLRAYKSRFIGMGAGGAQPNISREKIIATVIALPPEKEQMRIVSKISELFSICDSLKERIQQAQVIKNDMATSVLDFVDV